MLTFILSKRKNYEKNKQIKQKRGGIAFCLGNAKMVLAMAVFAISNLAIGQVTITTNTTWGTGGVAPPTSSGNDYREGIIVNNGAVLTINQLTGLTFSASKTIDVLNGEIKFIESELSANNNVTVNVSSSSSVFTLDESDLTFGDDAIISINAGAFNASNISDLTIGKRLKLTVDNQGALSISGSSTSFTADEAGLILIKNQSTLQLTGVINANFGGNTEIKGETQAGLEFLNAVCSLKVLDRINLYTGATLNLNNTQLIGVSGSPWDGIKAYQDNTQDQFSTGNTINPDGSCTSAEWSGVLNPMSTKVILDGATIAFALKGISAIGDNRRPFRSAVVRVRNSFFNNCPTGIAMTANFSGLFSPRGASYIMNTEFNWDNASMANIAGKKHIDLDLSVVNVGGCTFKNTTIQTSCSSNLRGIGINAYNSILSVAHDGDRCCTDDKGCPDNCYAAGGATSKRNTFNFLYEGINFSGNGSNSFGTQFSCRFSDFLNNYVSINLDGVNTAGIHANVKILVEDNLFLTSQSNVTTSFIYSSVFTSFCEPTAVKLNNCSGFNIYDNEFKSEGQEDYTFIEITNPDQLKRNEIRGNTFTGVGITNINSASVGISLDGSNNHLNIVCNTFDQCKPDIQIQSNGQINDIPNMDVYPLATSYPIDALNTYTHQGGGSTTNLNIYNLSSNSVNVYFHKIPAGSYSNFKSLGPVSISQAGDPFATTPCEYGGLCMIDNGEDPDRVNCTINDCEDLDQKETGSVSVRSIDQLGLAVFPNPSQSGIFNITQNRFKEVKIVSVTDFTGKAITYTYNKKEGQLKIPFKGFYLVILDVEGEQVTKKILTY